MTRANIITALLALLAVALGWVSADAIDWFRRRRASKGTGKARQVGEPEDPRSMAEFPNRAVRRRAAKQMTAQMMRQASAVGRRMLEQPRAPKNAGPPAPTLRERLHAWVRFKRTPRRPKGVLT